MCEKRYCFFFALCCWYKRYRHTKYILQFFVGCFGENSVLLDTDSEITHIVNRFGGNTFEITRARQRDLQKLFQKADHARATERHRVSNNRPLAQFEWCDGFFRRTGRRLLSGNRRDALRNKRKLFTINDRADTNRNNDFFKTRCLSLINIPKALLESRIGVLELCFYRIHK